MTHTTKNPERPGASASGDRMSGSALVVENLTKRFGDRTAFSDVSFAVGHGEVFGFLGPNGAGKTTTVRTLGTLLTPTSGSATVAGLPLRQANGVEIRRRIAIMPESPGLYLRLSVFENLRCFAGLYELPNPRERIDRALRAVKLVDRAGDPCGALSKGLRQRVGLARALLSDPQVLFLDEPTSGPRPGRRPRGPRAHRRPPQERRDDLPHHAPPRGGRASLRPRRDPQHDAAHDRSASRATRAALPKALVVKTLAPLAKPEDVFGGVPRRGELARGRRRAHTSSPSRTRPSPPPGSPGPSWRPAPTSFRSPSRATRWRMSISSSSTRTSR